MHHDDIGLVWYRWPWNRCRAVKEPNESGFWGRCELVRNHIVDHALDRGLDFPRWSTKWTR